MKSSGQPRKPRLFAVRRVVGESMYPTLKPGRIVLAVRLPLQKGSVVVAQHAGREVIKRITDLSSEGVFLRGDNVAASTDSRAYGRLVRSEIYGVVVWPFGLRRF